jgi:hypothetical protein
MTSEQLQAECERGQAQLMEMAYLQAEKTLADAERNAWANRDWDALSRLYMPLQEARRQRRQRAGEGIVCLDLLAEGPGDTIDPRHVVQNFSHGQLLVGGWATIEPALKVRELAAGHELFLDTFLAASFPTEAGRVAVIVPLPEIRLPEPIDRTIDQLQKSLPPGSLIFLDKELPRGSRSGTWKTYGEVMAIWERLHTPFLAAADAQTDPIAKMEGYRTAIRVDYACELAHQKLSDVARSMAR